eukprot:TRINITY_DN47703_c0_g1_i1.p1 TRINITY_DN47703_c0_g1~~TRINITY_DN47703_c0_g1_i1.p1  ORF type:complete len:459 (-),score=28.18 TRINITY_DN47703_c0_g1_i1:83-1399(-)
MGRHSWLERKAVHDSAAGATNDISVSKASQLWMVHGNWYDLTAFVNKHPGGAFWLSETRGMDITDLYETHHLRIAKPDAVLKGCLVGPAANDYVGFYDYAPDGLYLTLKRRVVEALDTHAGGSSDATTTFKIQCLSVLLAHLICFSMLCRSGPGGSLCWAILTGITVSALHGIGHNFMHQADNMWMYACVLGGWNVHLNRVSHAISHHPMPNTEWDLEILGHEPWLYNMVDRPANSKWVLVYGPWLCASGHLLDIMFTWMRILGRRQSLKFELFSNPLQLALLCSFGNGVATGCSMFLLVFLVFGTIDSYAGYPLHHTEQAWTVGDRSHERKRDLAEHIVASTVDYDIGTMGLWQSMLCYELMPNHCLHHIFPTVDCSRFDVIRPAFEKTLDEFGIHQKVIAQPYIYFGMFPAWLRGTVWESLVARWSHVSSAVVKNE